MNIKILVTEKEKQGWNKFFHVWKIILWMLFMYSLALTLGMGACGIILNHMPVSVIYPYAIVYSGCYAFFLALKFRKSLWK